MVVPWATTAIRRPSAADAFLAHTCVYLAAPFTSRAQERVLDNGDVVADQLHKGSYRTALTAMADTMEGYGATVVLPHRDISGWGARRLGAAEIARRCAEQVQTCDLVVALLGASFGAHVEVGVALGAGIPVVALCPADVEVSFFTAGLTASGLVAAVEAPSEVQLPEILNGPGFHDAVHEARAKAGHR